VRKYFYLCESQKRVICFKFLLNGGEELEVVYLEKYSQVIVDEENEQIFIINYRGIDNRHMILHGSYKHVENEDDVVVSEVK
jgi:hypothetical protein